MIPFLRALAAAATVLVVAAVGLVAVGIAFGNPWLLLPRVPPRSGMDRFLVWAWPTACLFEGVMAMAGDRSRWCPKQAFVEAGFGRLVAAAYLGGTLLAGSVFLQPDAEVLPLLAWAALCGTAWHLIASSRQQVVAAVVLVVAVLATGGLILLGGWIRGGLVAVPIAVAVGGVGLHQADAVPTRCRWLRGRRAAGADRPRPLLWAGDRRAGEHRGGSLGGGSACVAVAEAASDLAVADDFRTAGRAG